MKSSLKKQPNNKDQSFMINERMCIDTPSKSKGYKKLHDDEEGNRVGFIIINNKRYEI
jgi:hypothetical protein